jgi:hypothetical protein
MYVNKYLKHMREMGLVVVRYYADILSLRLELYAHASISP